MLLHGWPIGKLSWLLKQSIQQRHYYQYEHWSAALHLHSTKQKPTNRHKCRPVAEDSRRIQENTHFPLFLPCDHTNNLLPYYYKLHSSSVVQLWLHVQLTRPFLSWWDWVAACLCLTMTTAGFSWPQKQRILMLFLFVIITVYITFVHALMFNTAQTSLHFLGKSPRLSSDSGKVDHLKVRMCSGAECTNYRSEYWVHMRVYIVNFTSRNPLY